MKHIVKAIYENGVFKPVTAPEIPQGQQVRLEIEPLTEPSAEDILKLAAQVYQGLSEQDIDEIEAIARHRSPHFFISPGENATVDSSTRITSIYLSTSQ